MRRYILAINTVLNTHATLTLYRGQRRLPRLKLISRNKLSENFHVTLARLLKKSGITWHDLNAVVVAAGPGGFSSLRTGVAAGNAIAYALGIPSKGYNSEKILEQAAVSESLGHSHKTPANIRPIYSQQPNITRQRHFT